MPSSMPSSPVIGEAGNHVIFGYLQHAMYGRHVFTNNCITSTFCGGLVDICYTVIQRYGFTNTSYSAGCIVATGSRWKPIILLCESIRSN